MLTADSEDSLVSFDSLFTLTLRSPLLWLQPSGAEAISAISRGGGQRQIPSEIEAKGGEEHYLCLAKSRISAISRRVQAEKCPDVKFFEKGC